MEEKDLSLQDKLDIIRALSDSLSNMPKVYFQDRSQKDEVTVKLSEKLLEYVNKL